MNDPTVIIRVKDERVVIRAGVEIARLRILGVIPGEDPRVHFTRYKVEYMCCGRLAEVAHSTIVDRLRQPPRDCPSCCRTKCFQAYNDRRRRRKPTVVFDARGFAWPHLGRLGFRAGVTPEEAKYG